MSTSQEITSAAIQYCGEAHDSAAAAFRAIETYEVTLTTTDGETFDCQLGHVSVNEDNGQYVVEIVKTDASSEPIPGSSATLDIYDDIARVVVF